MKKGRNLIPFPGIILLCFICSIPYSLSGQKSDSLSVKKIVFKHKPLKINLKTNILSIFKGPFPVTSEYRLTAEIMAGKKHALYFSGAYIGRTIMYGMIQKQNTLNGQTEIFVSGYRIQGGYKYYIKNKDFRPDGLFIGPNISYSNAVYHSGNKAIYRLHAQKFSISALFGFQKIIADIVSIELFGGPGYFHTQWNEFYNGKTTDVSSDFPKFAFQFTLGFNAGVAF